MKLYTTTEAAARLGLLRNSVFRHIQRGTISAEKHGRDLFITEAELARFESSRRRPGRPPEKQNS